MPEVKLEVDFATDKLEIVGSCRNPCAWCIYVSGMSPIPRSGYLMIYRTPRDALASSTRR